MIPAQADCKRPFVLYADLNVTESKAWLVHKMLGAGELSVFYGAPGCGKGVIIEDLALHIASGHEWHGRPVTRGAVVYVALERKRLVERRAIAFRKRHGLEDLPFAIVGGVYDFRQPATAAEIANICRDVERETTERIVLVIVDTVSRALAGGDENSPKDMGALVTTVAKLQEKTEAAVLLVHHKPHDSERMRGHGALFGAVDTTVAVANTGSVRTAKVVKANDSEEGEGVAFTVAGVQIAADGTTAAVAIPADMAAAEPAKSKRGGNPRERRALSALAETVLTQGEPAPPSFGLTAPTNCVPLDSWRQELCRRDIIESSDKNPRATFKRIKEGMAAKGMIGILDDRVWAA
ncbi:AAA family ATPase [Bradyrhizobium elkanii]|uniref:AAA family ATPase n=1 Tax=Bradyrhizobium elkanii TaxID=29448 RepID=UPI0005713CFD|nr:AAA family ATPase [Bradyrhizobium elkanii]WLA78811.1 AAA family ATPase [Bradyrhizobium elkanii]